MAANIGDCAEGAFAITLALYVCQNDLMPNNAHLEPNLLNVKYWMKQIDPSFFENGGTWTKTLYDGKASLAKQIGKKTTEDQSKTSKTSKQIPVDYARVTISIGLKPKSVEGIFGQNGYENVTLDLIINQMLTDGGRYKYQIDSFKKRYMTNNTSEYIDVDIRTIGKEGEQSGGAIKGDIQLQVSIQRYSLETGKKIGSPHRQVFPTMYYSLKASATPPKTIANESPIKALNSLANAFGVDVLNSNKNVLITSITGMRSFFTTKSGKKQKWMIDLFGGSVGGSGSEGKYLITGAGNVNIEGRRIYDLLDPKEFPGLWRASGPNDRFWKSFVVASYVESVFDLIPNGLLDTQISERIWNVLLEAGFGLDPYAKSTFLLAYGTKTYQSSSVAYIMALKEAVGGKLTAKKSAGSVNFYIGEKENTKAKLFHIRYKNRSSYTGDISETASFDVEKLLKLELKLMPETGDAFKEKKDWRPGMKLNFDSKTAAVTVEKSNEQEG
jgi:hypothetical protein